MNHVETVVQTSNQDSLKECHGHMSNSADGSSKTSAVGSPSDSDRWILFLIFGKAVSVE